MTPAERGQIRERVHRHLRSYGPTSASGVMHGASITIDTAQSALDALLASGAVAITTAQPVKLYRAIIPR
jgi:hypothetical protein